MSASPTGETDPIDVAGGAPQATGHGRRIAGNFGLLTVFKLLSDAFTFGLFVVLSRRFGESGIGAYSFAVGFGSGFAVLADFGLYRLSIADLARRDGDFGREMASIFAMRLALTAGSILLLGAAALLLPIEASVRPILVIVGLHLLLYGIANGLGAVFVARQDMFLSAGIDFAAKALAAVTGVGLAYAGASLAMVLWALPVVTALQIAVTGVLVRRRYNPGRAGHEWAMIGRLRRMSLPYFVSTAVRYVTIRSDVVLLGFLRSAADVGVYNVAYRVVFLLMYLPFYASLAVFPVVARLHHHRRGEERELVRSAVGWMILIGVPVSVGVALVSRPLVALVFGPAFERAVPVLQILAWLFLLSCLRNMLATVMTACDQQAERTRLESLAAAIAIVGHFLLIARYGPLGAAAAILAAETILVVIVVVAMRRRLDLGFLSSRLAISLFGSAAFALPALLLPGLPLILLIAGAAAIYVAVAMAFPTIRRHELPALASLRLAARGGWRSPGSRAEAPAAAPDGGD
jgi:O-antigen/teichoic acid export membrane protein